MGNLSVKNVKFGFFFFKKKDFINELEFISKVHIDPFNCDGSSEELQSCFPHSVKPLSCSKTQRKAPLWGNKLLRWGQKNLSTAQISKQWAQANFRMDAFIMGIAGMKGDLDTERRGLDRRHSWSIALCNASMHQPQRSGLGFSTVVGRGRVLFTARGAVGVSLPAQGNTEWHS